MQYTYGTSEWEEAYNRQTNERIASEPKPYIVFLPEWVKAWEQYIQNDAKYKSVALPNWENPIIIHLQANPALGLDHDIFVKMDLWHNGECRSIRYIPSSEVGKPGDFVITGSVERWLSVARKQLDVVKGMMQGKLKLKGDLPTVVRAVKAAVRLVETVGEVGCRYPDELTPEQREQFRSTVNSLLADFSLI
ncbi:MAG TPA: SCP2 sterol-binding domain-containing protein [Deltaproteobacteria bacterium]|jgi:putative sterol carrier protein|nr:SCP2 sterol-binding domain-containing protein [Deltaproteobacteria bacterium]HOI05833.1 SCP2 sterol-binding domain-containing protein [Deltaproteobacteria bacterium]